MQEDLRKLQNLCLKAAEVSKSISEFRNIVAEKHCPVKVGDDIEVTVGHHKGKLMNVYHVWIRDVDIPNGKFQFGASGIIYNEDSSVGVSAFWESEIYSI